MRYATQPPWFEESPAVQGTPEEWVDWFHANDHEGQLEIAEWAIRFGQEATLCLMKHGGRS